MSSLATITFDYTTIPPDLAAEARATAERIQGRLRASYFDTGRDLIAMKERMPHGAFGSWLKAEFGMTDRTAENYMNAARLLEGKSETVSVLPPAVVYALAAPSAPPSFVNQVIAAVEAGNAPPVREIKAKLAEAIEADRKAKAEAAKTPETIKREREAEKRRKAAEAERSRRIRATMVAEDAERDAKAVPVARFLVDHLGVENIHEMMEMLRGTDWFRVERHFKAHGNYLLPASQIEAAFGIEAAGAG